VAQLLAGAWKGSSLPICPEELEQIANLITSCGAGGLAWCRIRGSSLNSSQTAELFQAQYRFQSLQAKLHERSLKKVIPLLRSVGVEPLLVKGWAIARCYPEAGMRPYIDLDLCVLPDDHTRASAALTSGECDDCNVDLHVGFGKFYDRRTNEIFARSRLMKLDDVDVRVLSAEDDLRFLCMHLLRHGAILPLWLCDIAVLLEARSSDFDWDRCLSGSRREADWLACAIGLTHQLLGVDVEGIPIAGRAHDLPSWLVPAVLQSWGTRAQALTQIKPLLRQPVSLLRNLPNEIRRHWPNPIEATMTLRGPFNRLPRLPFQVGHVISRSAVLLSQLLADIRGAMPYGS
jgi:hypothetical protein